MDDNPPEWAMRWDELAALAHWLRRGRATDAARVAAGSLDAAVADSRRRVVETLCMVWDAATKGTPLDPTPSASPAEIVSDLGLTIERMAKAPPAGFDADDHTLILAALQALRWWSRPAPNGGSFDLTHIQAHVRVQGWRGSWQLPGTRKA